MTTITEAPVEAATLDWLSTLDWRAAHGPDIVPDTPNAERDAPAGALGPISWTQ